MQNLLPGHLSMAHKDATQPKKGPCGGYLNLGGLSCKETVENDYLHIGKVLLCNPKHMLRYFSYSKPTAEKKEAKEE